MDFEARVGFDVPSSRTPLRADDEVPTEAAAELSLVESEFFITRLISELRISSG
jgi:hypothetical protein